MVVAVFLAAVVGAVIYLGHDIAIAEQDAAILGGL